MTIIIREQPCATCEGKGTQTNLLWLEFWAAFPDCELPQAAEEGWWRERGYAITGLPAINENCATCQGSGVADRPSRFDPDRAFARLMSHYGGV